MKRMLLVTVSMLFLVSLSIGAGGYVIHDTDRPLDGDVNFFELNLDIKPNAIEENEVIVLETNDVSTGEPVEGVELYIENEYVGETSSAGIYRFSLEESGEYEARAEIAQHEDSVDFKVNEPAPKRQIVSNNANLNISGNFFLNATNLEVFTYLAIILLLIAGYLDHIGKIKFFSEN